jgi:hypothetical protein
MTVRDLPSLNCTHSYSSVVTRERSKPDQEPDISPFACAVDEQVLDCQIVP